jgi:hypothetical protein
MTFDANERSLLAGLADVFIPAGDGFPSASEAGVADEGLDEVLSVRPDLAAGLKKLLAKASGHPPAEIVSALRKNDPAGFGILAELVPGAYFLNSQVRTKLGYHGQTAHPIDPQPDYLEADLPKPPAR